jgi:hypothetical protein
MDSLGAQTAASPAPPGHTPDWATIPNEVLCPLCEYNLRGLVEPRCPECGHRFDWAQLLDDVRHTHPWLFEQQRRGLFKSYLSTFFTSQFPRRFWRSVHASHTVRLRGLLRYWLISVIAVVPALLAVIGVNLGAQYFQVYQTRQELIAHMKAHPQDPRTLYYLARAASPEDAARQFFRYPTAAQALNALRYGGGIGWNGITNLVFPLVVAWVLWPWFTLAALQVFRRTMRQARIRSSHVLRCAIYSGDAGLLVMIPVFAVLGPLHLGFSGSYNTLNFFLSLPLLLTFLVALIVLTYRLCLAYRLYLRFPHALATCIASQVMVALGMTACYALLAW